MADGFPFAGGDVVIQRTGRQPGLPTVLSFDEPPRAGLRRQGRKSVSGGTLDTASAASGWPLRSRSSGRGGSLLRTRASHTDEHWRCPEADTRRLPGNSDRGNKRASNVRLEAATARW